MGLGWHVALERALVVEPMTATDGRSLIFYQHQLDAAAHKLELTPLTGFVSAVPKRVAEYLRQQGLDPEQFPVDDEEWFDAAEGLQTVRGLIAHIAATPQAVTDSYRVLRDLRLIEQVLTVAEREQTRFHLTSDLPPPGSEVSSESPDRR
ncbi:MAG: hypothetical protein K2R98_30100 [Gemmataceae bacterium]|nr:hypothetical protein [Gemmataceae bacterium]